MKSRVLRQVILMNEARSLEFAEMVGGARALIKAIPPKKPATVLPFPLKIAPLLRPLRDKGGNLLRDLQAVLDLSDEQQTDELVSITLARVSFVLDSLGFFVKTGDDLFEKGALLPQDWPPEIVSELMTLVDDFEDLQESIALGLSEEFKKELESAR